ncbi:MAG: pyridoxal phosphate-dependent aminotransferase [bacterium]
MKKLSKAAEGLIGQPMFAFLAKAKELEKNGKSILHFEIGDPNFNSPQHVKNSAKKAIDEDLTHYSSSMGILEFREAISCYTKLNWGFEPSVDQVMICPANALIDFVVRCVVDHGEEVIYPDPGFPTYYSVLNYNGIAPIGIILKEENGFRMDPQDIKRKITDKTRLIILNSPQNPTGAVMTQEEIVEVANIAEEHDLYILSDEVYAKIIYEKKHYSPSVLDLCKERTIIINSLSKTYSMAGWRLGYAVGPEEVIKKLGLMLQTILSCLPIFTQQGGIAAIMGDQRFLHDRVQELRLRRDILTKGLKQIPGISCLIPDGAFYAFPNISGTEMNDGQFSNKLLEEVGVCALPGSCFGGFGKKNIRLCYASIDAKGIKEALKRIEHFIAKL